MGPLQLTVTLGIGQRTYREGPTLNKGDAVPLTGTKHLITILGDAFALPAVDSSGEPHGHSKATRILLEWPIRAESWGERETVWV
jgi:hypothetical protein